MIKSPCHNANLCSGNKIMARDKGLLPTQAILGKHLLASELPAQHSSNKDLFLVISRGLTLGLGGHQ